MTAEPLVILQSDIRINQKRQPIPIPSNATGVDSLGTLQRIAVLSFSVLTVANIATQMLSARETPAGHLYRPGEVTGINTNTLGLDIGYACKY